MPPLYVYIAGYSRSGSTLLDVLLGSHPDIFGSGELTYLYGDYARADRRCTCGALYRDCPVWSGAPGDLPSDELARTLRCVERRSALAALTAGNLPVSVVERYASANTRLFAHIRKVTGKTVIVDSSKSARDAAGRPFALARHTGEDVRVVHLVRDLPATVDSYIRRGSNWRLEGRDEAPGRWLGERAMIGWILANRIATDLGRRLGPDRYMRLAYEQLVGEPLQTLERLQAFMSLDLSPVAERIRSNASFGASHNVGGNRMRHDEVRLDKRRPAVRLPLIYRAPVSVLDRVSGNRRSAAELTTALVTRRS